MYKGSEFNNSSVKSWLQDKNIKMYSAHNERKSVVAESWEIKHLENKIYKHMTATSKNEYIDKLDDTVKYNNAHHRKIKMKSVDLKVMIEVTNSKLLIMWEYQKIRTFLLNATLNIDQNKILLLKKSKTQYHWHRFLVMLTVNKFLQRLLETLKKP